MAGLRLDVGIAFPDRRTVRRDGALLPLTAREAELLAYLAARADEDVPRDSILRDVWGYHPDARTRTVDVIVGRIRAKIEREPSRPRHLLTVPGVGFRFHAADELPAAVPSDGPSFFGRDAELVAIAAAFEGGARIVTLHGPGGVGKTRLARRYAAGGQFVELDAATDLVSLGLAVARQLGITDPAAIGPALAARGELVVLDNFEQLLATPEPAARIAAWAAAAPTARFLVTSRQRLRIVGETSIAVAPLATSEAVALFQARAAEAGATVAPVAVAVEIVRRVEGLPLAIELAAACAATLPSQEVLRRLGHSLDVGRGRRDAPNRHRTLTATVAWSWDLLEPIEQDALAALTTFAGPCSLVAAEAVIGDEALTRIVELAERSLVRVTEQPGLDGEARVAPFVSAREFAAKHLTNREAVAARHVAHYASAAASWVAALHDESDRTALWRIELELDELRLALRRATVSADRAALAVALAIHAARRGPAAITVAELGALAAQADPADRPRLLDAQMDLVCNAQQEAEVLRASEPFSGENAELDFKRCRLLRRCGRGGEARGGLEALLASDLPWRVRLHALFELAWMVEFTDPKRSRGLLGEARALSAGRELSTAWVDEEVSIREVEARRYGNAIATLRRNVAIYAAWHDRDSEITARLRIARALHHAGDLASASAAFRETRGLASRGGMALQLAMVDANAARLAIEVGDFEAARAALVDDRPRTRAWRAIADALDGSGSLEAVIADHAEALSLERPIVDRLLARRVQP